MSANYVVSPKTLPAFGGFDVFGEEFLNGVDSRDLEDRVLEKQGAPATDFARYHIRVTAPAINRIVRSALHSVVTNESYRGRPLFLFVNYLDAHDPYFPLPQFDDALGPNTHKSFNGDLRSSLTNFRSTRGLSQDDLTQLQLLYDREIRQVDHYVGELMDFLSSIGLDENLMVWITADHGELLGEGGNLTHDIPGAFEGLQKRVPLILYADFLTGTGKRIDSEIQLSDILPTIADFLGGPCPEGVLGKSIRGILERAAPPREQSRSQVLRTRGVWVPAVDPSNIEEESILLERLRALGYVGK